jgi:hypothetical protein
MTQQGIAPNRRSIPRVAGTLAALAISVVVLAGSAAPSHAATAKAGLAASTAAGLDCAPSSEGYQIYLPFKDAGQFSLFFVSVDGGAWGTTNWFYSGSFQTFEYTSAGWRSAGLYFDGPIGGNHDVRAWEFRYYLNGTSEWVNLGSCRTSNNGGWLITY